MMCAWVVLSLLRRACGEHTDLAHRPERRVSVVHGKGCEGFLMLVRCSDLHICMNKNKKLYRLPTDQPSQENNPIITSNYII